MTRFIKMHDFYQINGKFVYSRIQFTNQLYFMQRSLPLFFKSICLFILSQCANTQIKAQIYYKDVAPIFIANCTSCHHEGGLSFSLNSYTAVKNMAGSISPALQNNIMPPWPADPTYKHYAKERIVSAADKAMITNWIAQGTLAGDTTLAPTPPTYGSAQLNGSPDMVLALPKFTSNASSSDMYICVNVPVNLTQDRYIRAFEFIPGNQQLIHHAVITIDTTGLAVDDYSGSCFNFQGQINIGDFAPGMGPTVLPGVNPVKFGFRLKAGAKMSFQIHIPHGTAGMMDSSKLNLFFYPLTETGIRPMYFETALQNWNFYIPANAVVKSTAKYPTTVAGVPIDISLYGAFPHSHKTCTSILNFAYKNADTIPLVRIPKWDFHWQGQYTFKKMVKLPQGYHLFSEHVFDNTVNNPETPNPSNPVLPGTNTDDEMLFDSYLYSLYQAGDENVDIEAILAADTLFYPTGYGHFDKTIQTVNAYPNPFSKEIHITYSLLSAQFVRVKIVDLKGNIVAQLASGIESSGSHTHIWDAKDQGLPSGIYFYQIEAGQSKSSGKILLK